MKWLPWIITALSVGATAMLLIARFELQAEQPFLDADQDIINRSIHMYAAEQRRSAEDVMSNRFPVVARGPQMRCVNLLLKLNSLGSSPVYCFDERNNLIYRARF